MVESLKDGESEENAIKSLSFFSRSRSVIFRGLIDAALNLGRTWPN